MKIFKRTAIFAFVLLICLCLVGCGNPTTAKAVGTSANRNADRIMRVLNNLDTASDEDFDIVDISPITLQNNYEQVKNVNHNDYTLSNKVNGNNKTLPKLVNYSQNDGNIRDKSYRTKPVNNNIITKSLADSTNVKINENKVRNYSYTPKYINATSEKFSNQNLQNYFAKIEDLYSNCADCISSNAECNDCKQNLINACLDCKDLCTKLENGTIKLSESQIQDCNECLGQLSTCIDKLNKSKGELSSLIKTLKPFLKNYNNNFESLIFCYGNLGMCLDKRIDNLNECTNCINKLNEIICQNCDNCENCKNQSRQEFDNSNTQVVKTTNNKNNVSFNERPLNNSTTKINNNGKKTTMLQRIKSAMQNIKLPEKWRRNSTMQTKTLNNNNSDISNPNINNNQNNTTTLMPNTSLNNGQAFTSNNPAFSNVYHNGLGFGNNRLYPYNRYNIDTYASTPRNIDTYQNIRTNIDTYRKDYLQNFNNEQNIIAEPLENNDVKIDENQMSDNVDVNHNISAPIPNNSDFNVNNIPQNDNQILEDKNLTTSPLPNPFDPQKVEQEKKNDNKESEIDKENGQVIENPTENNDDLILDNENIDKKDIQNDEQNITPNLNINDLQNDINNIQELPMPTENDFVDNNSTPIIGENNNDLNVNQNDFIKNDENVKNDEIIDDKKEPNIIEKNQQNSNDVQEVKPEDNKIDIQNDNKEQSSDVMIITDKQNIKANLTIEIEDKEPLDEIIEPVENPNTNEN